MVDIQCVAQTEDVIGEIPLWDEREQALYWIDIFKPALHRLDGASGKVTSWTPPEKSGSFAIREGGGFLMATRSGLAFYEPKSGSFERVVDLEPDLPDNFLNDGHCDRQGRFWVGSMDKLLENPTGRLHRYEGDGSHEVCDNNIWISNGVAFSPDGTVMYFADSHYHAIYAYDLDPASGAVSNKRLFASTEGKPGVPDGATVDSQGFLWSAQFDGGCVYRYTPDGDVDRKIELPVSRPAAVAFGGANFEILYVTTARFRLPHDALERQPLAGAVLAVDAGVTGLPEPRFKG